MINRLFHTEDFWVYSIIDRLMTEESLNADELEKYEEVQDCLNVIIDAILEKAGHKEKFHYKCYRNIVTQEKNEQIYVSVIYEKRVGYSKYMLIFNFPKLVQIAQLMYYKSLPSSKCEYLSSIDWRLNELLDSEVRTMIRVQ